jgi:hypothetical protein
MAESTPFLADSDHDDDYERESHPIKTQPANARFKRPIKLLSAFNSFLSLGAFGLLIASYILTSTGPFNYTYRTNEAIRDLAIVVSTVLYFSLLVLIRSL